MTYPINLTHSEVAHLMWYLGCAGGALCLRGDIAQSEEVTKFAADLEERIHQGRTE